MKDVYIKGEKEKSGNWFLLSVSIFILLVSTVFFIVSRYPLIFGENAKLENNQEINPYDPIIINFSKPVLQNRLGWNVESSPEVAFSYRMENYNRKLVIIPSEFWPLEKNIQIHVSGKNILLNSIDTVVSFNTIAYPAISGFYPAAGEKDVVLDIEDPIKASFDRSLDNFKLKFIINPFRELDSLVDSKKNEISLMSKEDLEKGRKYSISVYIRYKDEKEEEYRKIYETFFETKSNTPPAWEKDFAARIEQAKKFTEVRIKEGKYIDINLKSQIMAIFENGELLDAYMISSGKRGFETPQGSFKIHNKVPRAWSKKYGLFMPHWMAIIGSGSYGIHELPEWPGGYKEGANHLGTPVSHGCVRLGVGPAERVFGWAEIGTPVVIHS